MSPVVRANLGEKSSFEMLPTGIVRVAVVKYDIGNSKNGDEMHTVRFQISEPESAKGRILFGNYVQLPQSMWSWEQLLNACGVETPAKDDMAAREAFEFDTDEVNGSELKLRIGPGNDDRYTSNNINEHMPLDDPREVGFEETEEAAA